MGEAFPRRKRLVEFIILDCVFTNLAADAPPHAGPDPRYKVMDREPISKSTGGRFFPGKRKKEIWNSNELS
jgi:hypothetical protein